MYQFFSQISAWLSEPFGNAAYSTNIALLSALFFGFVGSVAPCQISANIGAITYFGSRQAQARLSWSELGLYLAGKIAVFSVFGLLFWAFGQGISTGSIPLFVYARKFLGPLLIVMGLFLIGWIRMRGVGYRISASLRNLSERIGGKWGAFFNGRCFFPRFLPDHVFLVFLAA